MTSTTPLIGTGSGNYENYYSRAHAESLDEQDPLKHLRREFIIPTKHDLKSRTLAKTCKFHCRSSILTPH